MLFLLHLTKVKVYESKKCIYCNSSITKKNGKKNGIQQFKCHVCGKQFLGGYRISTAELWDEYSSGKQTYAQLSKKYQCSIRTISRKLDKYKINFSPAQRREVIVLMDTTYWGRGFGVMLFKDAISKENLLKYYVKNETNIQYIEGVNQLKERGFTIVAIVCDGRKGLVQSFKGIPVQMCQFHQVAINTTVFDEKA